MYTRDTTDEPPLKRQRVNQSTNEDKEKSIINNNDMQFPEYLNDDIADMNIDLENKEENPQSHSNCNSNTVNTNSNSNSNSNGNATTTAASTVEIQTKTKTPTKTKEVSKVAHTTKPIKTKMARKKSISGGIRSAKSKSKTKTKTKAKTRKPAGLIPGRCSCQTKKQLTDRVKSAMTLNKWTIEATCIRVKMDCTAFKWMFGEHGTIIPNNYDENTPVVVCRLNSQAQCGDVFGKSKIKGGSRYGEYHITSMDIVFTPPTHEVKMWFAVSGW